MEILFLVPFFILLSYSVPLHANTESCESNWVLIDHDCYLIQPTKVNQSKAISICENAGNLLDQTVHLFNFDQSSSSDKIGVQNFVACYLSFYETATFWIGYTRDPSKRENFTQLDGQGISYTNWAPRKPDDVNGNESCVIMHGRENRKGLWDDVTCDSEHGYICHYKPSVEKLNTNSPKNQECLEGWSSHDNKCYIPSSQALSFNEASRKCQSIKTEAGNSTASLASVENDQLNQILLCLLVDHNIYDAWIGLKAEDGEGEWTDGTKLNSLFEKKIKYEKGCIHLDATNASGVWYGSDCALQKKYICQYSIDEDEIDDESEMEENGNGETEKDDDKPMASDNIVSQSTTKKTLLGDNENMGKNDANMGNNDENMKNNDDHMKNDDNMKNNDDNMENSDDNMENNDDNMKKNDAKLENDYVNPENGANSSAISWWRVIGLILQFIFSCTFCLL